MPSQNVMLSLDVEINRALTELSKETGIPKSKLVADAIAAHLPGVRAGRPARSPASLSPTERVVILALEKACDLDEETWDDIEPVLTPTIAQGAGLPLKTCERLLKRLATKEQVTRCGDDWDGQKTRTWGLWRPIPRVHVWINRATGHRLTLPQEVLYKPNGKPATPYEVWNWIFTKGDKVNTELSAAEFI